jgi:multiple sugar transport system ATP-binding protein
VATVTLDHVRKVYKTRKREVRAVDDVSLSAADQEFVVLVGPSGCGKTTMLRLIAGLEDPDGGEIRIGQRVVNDVAPKDRDIAMVFQNYALYPHMTVAANLGFGLKMRRVAKGEIRQRVGEVAEMLGLTHLLDSKPAALSGGERQRVAVGRAIVRRPQVFLFDEPLSNLDAKLRVRMRTELKSMHQKLRDTIIYVTHDQEEAMTLGDQLVIMNEGKVQQSGAPLDLYNCPVNRFVAGFIGTPPMNFLRGRLEGEGGTLHFAGPAGRLSLPKDSAAALPAHTGQAVTLGVRPELLKLSDSDAAGGAVLRASVVVVEPLGDSAIVHLDTSSGERVVVRVPPTLAVAPGQNVDLIVDMARAHLFSNGQDGERLNAVPQRA